MGSDRIACVLKVSLYFVFARLRWGRSSKLDEEYPG